MDEFPPLTTTKIDDLGIRDDKMEHARQQGRLSQEEGAFQTTIASATERVITSSREACSGTDKSEERQIPNYDRCGVVVLRLSMTPHASQNVVLAPFFHVTVMSPDFRI
jgi:hypothetical protein